ncbi:nucleotide exchange factor GrpE [Nonomuraea sp. NPDC005983]|uniref:nucleotide exchange factor GrpE n=1 Tax=Nonomuraea sp. NPDC005983 TaxID=3155595 RepID=UPI0033B53477
MNGHEEVPGTTGRMAEAQTQEDTQESPLENGAAETDAKLAELEDRWLRAVADLDNLRKRIARDSERLRAEERDRVTAEWLPVLDNLELALSHAGQGAGEDADAIVAGVRAVRDQAVAALSRLGYARHDETGVPFDPTRHEAVATVERDDVEPGTVVDVLRPGYGDGRRQLRPAVVVVAKKVA